MKIGSCACFLIFSGVLFVLPMLGTVRSPFGYHGEMKTITITFLSRGVQCYLSEVSDYTLKLETPSLESFIRASTGEEGQELRLSGLATSSRPVNNACQSLADVTKAKIQVNKIALISLANETVCPLQGLVEQAQNAGYSVVIFFYDFSPDRFENGSQLQDKLLIPVLYVEPYAHSRCYFANNSFERMGASHLSAADRTKIDIMVAIVRTDLKKMQQYLRRLYYWFLLGPLITIEWLRRRKKLFHMSGGQQADRGRVTEDTAVESAVLNAAADHEETQRNNSKTTDHEQTGGKAQPLFIVLDDASETKNGHTRHRAIRLVLNYLAAGSGYVILIVVALPVGISGGGWSFFRFDQNEIQQKSFLDDLITSHHSLYSSETFWLSLFFDSFLPLWWSPLQIFFFLYSRYACKTTWTVPTNFSKLIRSDWFASNMYLLILGVVVPYCSSGDYLVLFSYFTSYNTVCTICNVLFITILNKHKFVTRYVFYISVCMIFAYIESDIVAVFYFMMNSTGSLTNLNLTALRTVAIGITLTLSFSFSMHIIRKLSKSRESLFEGLGEK